MNEFLKSAESFNEKYASIEADGVLEKLNHCFWSTTEIENGKELRSEWDVPFHLIPFYGDWHDLFCFDVNTNKIVSLNDDRQVICTWDDKGSFIESLIEPEVEPSKKPKLASYSLSSSLREKANEFKKRNT